jgi:hypothetical protein
MTGQPTITLAGGFQRLGSPRPRGIIAAKG